MNRRHYHISVSSAGKSAHPLARLLAGIIALAAVPVVLFAFAGVMALLLAVVVSIAAAIVFLKLLTPVSPDRHRSDPTIIEDVEFTEIRDDDAAPAPPRKTVVIEHEDDTPG